MNVLKYDTEVPAYSDTLGTREKCHCNQIVTVTRGSVVLNLSFGTCQKCHCKRGVTVNSVTVSGEICSELSISPLHVCSYFCSCVHDTAKLPDGVDELPDTQTSPHTDMNETHCPKGPVKSAKKIDRRFMNRSLNLAG